MDATSSGLAADSQPSRTEQPPGSLARALSLRQNIGTARGGGLFVAGGGRTGGWTGPASSGGNDHRPQARITHSWSYLTPTGHYTGRCEVLRVTLHAPASRFSCCDSVATAGHGSARSSERNPRSSGRTSQPAGDRRVDANRASTATPSPPSSPSSSPRQPQEEAQLAGLPLRRSLTSTQLLSRDAKSPNLQDQRRKKKETLISPRRKLRSKIIEVFWLEPVRLPFSVERQT